MTSGPGSNEVSLRRVFLVGCPRSGTTVLQSAISRHMDLVTFPESHFYDQVLMRTRRLARNLGLVSAPTWLAFRDFALSLDSTAELPSRKPPGLTRAAICRRFIALLDSQARAHRSSGWLEKTPGHSAYIPLIARYASDARFVHIIREAAPVVASLQRVTAQHPHTWGGAWGFEKCLERWERAIGDTFSHGRTPERHFIVVYEDFASRPAHWLAALQSFLDIPRASPGSVGAGSNHILASEPWKSGAAGPIEQGSTVREGAFSPDEEASIEAAGLRSHYSVLRQEALVRLATIDSGRSP